MTEITEHAIEIEKARQYDLLLLNKESIKQKPCQFTVRQRPLKERLIDEVNYFLFKIGIYK